MRFGVAVPTGTEGMMYPVPYADPEQAVDIAVAAERLGFDSVWGNDHVSTQRYVRDSFSEPPRFYDPYVFLTWVAATTSRVTLGTAITVMTFRHPVVLAKQAMTLSVMSGGRFVLGVGIGAYREETEAMWPGRRIHRGDYAAEFMQACTALFTQRRASFDGEYVTFADVESYPKPAAGHLPMWSGGNSAGCRERAARYGDGWLPACLTPDEVAAGVREITSLAERAGRVLPAQFEVAPQMSVSVGATSADAMDHFRTTQLHHHLQSLSQSTLKGRQDGMENRNLIGSHQQLVDRIGRYAEAGVTTLSGLLFAADTVPETLDQMADFAENVMRVFAPTPTAAVG